MEVPAVKQENKVYAGIVTYNPDLKVLAKNIFAVSGQVEQVVIFDNGSQNQKKLKQMLSEQKNVSMLCSISNEGIAYALNRLMEWGDQNGFWAMLTLDQDSVCASNHVKELSEILKKEPKAAIAAPTIQDRIVGTVGHEIKKGYRQVRTCISSGMIARIDCWRKVGGYDEYLFIDSVDFDFCYNLRKYGYFIFQSADTVLQHRLGNSKKYRFLFWNVTVMSHSAFRKYYIARNNIYYPVKHKNIPMVVRGNCRNAGLIFLILLYENDKKNKMQAVIKGWCDGWKKRR